ncbi:large ribosomal subunit protein uL10z-like [Nicotiana tabacum]|uniref:Large ribosomal subunit protein uL10z-like n=1 Tax=Nicotiana tabacum TaxID=4097 RepID=A0AC58TQL2_TOBAC
MAPKATKAKKKIAYDSKMCQLLDEYTQVLVAAAANVGSTQLQNIRKDLRGDSIGDLKEVSEKVAKYKVGAPTHVGLVAPVDVVVPPGNTGLDPSQTSFFQVLNIPTKINKGTVEIFTPVELIKKGDKS